MMASNQPQVTLLGFLLIPIVEKAAEKRLLGGYYIRFGRFLLVCGDLYETGAILGRANRDKLSTLARMIASPGKEEETIEDFQKVAKKRLERFGTEPDTFHMFILSTELARLGLELADFPDVPEIKKMKPFNEKWPYNEHLELLIKGFILEGIGFGSVYPELTEQMWRNAYERIDRESWSKARAYGLSIPEEPPVITLEEQEQMVLEMVGSYASMYYPELVESLNLPVPQP